MSLLEITKCKSFCISFLCFEHLVEDHFTNLIKLLLFIHNSARDLKTPNSSFGLSFSVESVSFLREIDNCYLLFFFSPRLGARNMHESSVGSSIGQVCGGFV